MAGAVDALPDTAPRPADVAPTVVGLRTEQKQNMKRSKPDRKLLQITPSAETNELMNDTEVLYSKWPQGISSSKMNIKN